MKILLDMMGGDNAPLAPLAGAAQAVKEYGVEIVGLGDEALLRKTAQENSIPLDGISFVHCTETIEMCDEPSRAVRRKKDSSLVVGLNMLKDGQGDAFVSAGSTGALHVGTSLIVRTLAGVKRPALATIVPAKKQPYLLVDCGANAECKPEYLEQFALMGQAYMKGVMGIEDPKVGLLNIGAEDEKGDTLRKSAFPLLKENDKINFYGNVEARDALTGCVQVIVCDGFSGNILLKSTEGAVQLLFGKLKEGLYSSTRAKVGALLVKPALKGVKNQLDYEQYGGAALLGVTGALVKAHGSSKAHAFACAIRQARSMVEGNVVGIIAQQLKSETADA